jgi:hypothetical protein
VLPGPHLCLLPSSLGLGPGELDDLGPSLGFLGKVPCEVAARQAQGEIFSAPRFNGNMAPRAGRVR